MYDNNMIINNFIESLFLLNHVKIQNSIKRKETKYIIHYLYHYLSLQIVSHLKTDSKFDK